MDYSYIIVKNWGFGTGIPVNLRKRAVAGSGESWIEIAERDKEVDEGLHYFAYDIPNWFDLVRIYEVIRDDVGGGQKNYGEKKIKESGWVEKTEISRFLSTAHQQRHRYARSNKGRHSNPMSLLEAESLIRELLEYWLRSK